MKNTGGKGAAGEYAAVGTQTGVTEATPHRLIQMLLDGALDKIAMAKGPKAPKKRRQLCGAILIVCHIQHGFDPATDRLDAGQMLALDRWAVAKTHALQQQILDAYRDYNFHLIYQKLHNFCAVDMSAFYLDVLKDRLYIPAPDDPDRRSAQTVLHEIATWLAENLTGEFAQMRFRGGPGDEHVFVDERKAWERKLHEGRWTCIGWRRGGPSTRASQTTYPRSRPRP